jgi:adenine deaminase
MTSAEIRFRRLDRQDFELLSEWLDAEHVRIWWREDADLGAIEDRYGPVVDGIDPTEVFVIEHDGRAIGLIQRYRLDDDLSWQATLSHTGTPHDAAGIDYLIGIEQLTGRGLGPDLIDRFVEQTWARYQDIVAVVVAVQEGNIRSWRALEKIGFRRAWSGELVSDDPSDEGINHVYVLHRPPPDGEEPDGPSVGNLQGAGAERLNRDIMGPVTSKELTEFIRGIPKVELHVHIEGTLEPELKFAMAERNRIALPYADAAAMRKGYAFDDLPSFLACYYEGMGVLQTAEDFADLARAYLRRAHEQHVQYAEIFFDPQAHTARGVALDVVIGGLRTALLEARQRFGMRAQLVMCFLRDLSPDYAMATLVDSLRYREWIVGVGLDSDERGNPPVKFADVFRRARVEGYQVTMHCDVDQEGSTEHIRQCLDVIGVDRIDHGVNALDDDELCAEIERRGVGLTCCPISNRYVTGSLKADEIKQLLDRGVRVTINSDDPAYFPGYVTDNLLALHEAVDLSVADIVRLQRNAIAIAWLPEAAKEALNIALDRYAVAAQ